jgi:hypothetical protein
MLVPVFFYTLTSSNHNYIQYVRKAYKFIPFQIEIEEISSCVALLPVG